MRTITNLLLPADAAIRSIGIVNEQGVVEAGSQAGHIAGFGAMVINLDLLPAVAVYMEDPKRRQIVDALAKTLNPAATAEQLFAQIQAAAGSTLPAKRLMKEKVVNASVALKMMIRTYKILEDHD